jgi:uncharacterized membrane protein YeaQ/YmgE (transglycosylase-associated protein family)
MSVMVPITLSLILGWLATLILQARRADVAILDFMIATLGAGVAAALGDRWLGIPLVGVHGVTMSGIGLMFAGAIGVLFAANMLRRGRPVRRRQAFPTM